MIPQPVFRPEPGDLERVVAREFPGPDKSTASEILLGFEPGSFSVSEDRVKIACLYLARGSLERLALTVAEANLDFRDVIAPAEYDAYVRLDPSSAQDELDRAVVADTQRYEHWLVHG